jgi:hypothetical protein
MLTGEKSTDKLVAFERGGYSSFWRETHYLSKAVKTNFVAALIRRAGKSNHVLDRLTDTQGGSSFEQYTNGTEISGLAMLRKRLGALADQFQGQFQFKSLRFSLFHFISCL